MLSRKRLQLVIRRAVFTLQQGEVRLFRRGRRRGQWTRRHLGEVGLHGRDLGVDTRELVLQVLAGRGNQLVDVGRVLIHHRVSDCVGQRGRVGG